MWRISNCKKSSVILNLTILKTCFYFQKIQYIWYYIKSLVLIILYSLDLIQNNGIADLSFILNKESTVT